MMLLNDKNPELNEVLTQMKENEGYCPCSLEKDPDTNKLAKMNRVMM